MALANDTTAPDFELPNQFGEHIRLHDFRGVKPVALVFFSLAFSPVCTSELGILRDNIAVSDAHGVELLGISVDSKATLGAFAESQEYAFTLLADFWPHGDVAKQYGVFLKDKGFADRATFVIDIDGVIRASFITQLGVPRPLDAYTAAFAELHAVRA